MDDKFWRTGISKVEPNQIEVRGYEITELINKASFGDAVFLLLSGEWPRRREGRLMEAILVSCCDHSLVAPSTDATRLVASGGVPLPTAVAAGILAVGDNHGGAIERCAAILHEALPPEEGDQAAAAARIVKSIRDKGERFPGFGHPMHQEDPRVEALFQMAAELGLITRWVPFARQIEAALESEVGRRLPMNVDGAIAALLLEMELDWRAGKALFLLSRAAGLSAHYLEQVTKEPPFKSAGYQDIDYNGPASRKIPE